MRIVYWILANKEWLFSGIGVAVILVGGGLVRRRLLSGRRTSALIPATEAVALTTAPPALAPVPQTFIAPVPIFTKPSPDDIHNQIDSLPPYQQRFASDAYKGLRVCWQAVFGTIQDDGLNKSQVVLRQPDRSRQDWTGMIRCRRVDISAQPRLKIAHVGEQVIVRGTIAEVDDFSIHLRDVTIDFV
jgi:hypothetical protein